MCGFIRGCCCECACAAGTVVESFFAACSLTFIAVTSDVFAGGAVALGSTVYHCKCGCGDLL